MNLILTPKHLRLRPVARAVLGGALAMGGLVAWPAHAVNPVATNPEPAKRALLLAATCNPCAAKKKAYGACNPCAAKKAACGACNPCAAKKKS